MKQLNNDGTITIPSNHPRTRRGPDSRGIRICVKELGRSCSLMQGYIIFTDGSAYAYDVPSNDEMESLCDDAHRGIDFNFRVRRSRGGYVRGFTPPGDYETIYSYPPYAGTTPTACPVNMLDWSQLFWVIVTQAPCGSTIFAWSHTGAMGFQQGITVDNSGSACNSTWESTGTLSYTGGAQNATATIIVDDFLGSAAWTSTVDVTVNGVNVLSASRTGAANYTEAIPFTVPDTMGAAFVVAVDLTFSTNAGGAWPDQAIVWRFDNV